MSRRLVRTVKQIKKMVKLPKNEEVQFLQIIKKAACDNAGEVFYKMAQYYMEGLFGNVDKNNAIRFYNLAIDENYEEAYIDLINLYYDDENYFKVNELCLQLYNKDNNNISAIKTLINIYVEHDYEHTDEFLHELTEKAIELNDNDAMINKAIIIFKNYEKTDDKNEEEKEYGIELLEKCIQNNYGYGFYIKAKIADSIIFNEEFKEEDKFELFNLAVINKSLYGHYELGIYYESDKEYNFVNRNYKKAYNYFLDGWKNGDHKCALRLADYYNKGIFVKKNINKALKYFLLALEGLDNKSTRYENIYYNIGYIYYEKGDYRNAFKYFELGRIDGCKNCYLLCGLMYKYGYHVKINHTISYEFIKKSVELGNNLGLYDLALYEYELYHNVQRALELLNDCRKHNIENIEYLYGHIFINEFNDYDKGFLYYTKAVEDYNCAQSHIGLGLLYYYGRGVERDINKSLEHFNNGYEKLYNLNEFTDFIHFIPFLTYCFYFLSPMKEGK